MRRDPRQDTPVDDAWHNILNARTDEEIDAAQADWMRKLEDEEANEDSITETHD